ncbi:hypothetical protein [Pseudodesulfovibrio pelocollis]|uniref:hypothetical protein n=1 Tax=Pseudodesulfovibrio pelocollis TaxID=3051432 RepID=UPI00255AEDA0|nr:hypothetical protein [Pseudodesulfovibrio sp. SB368]
MRFRFIAMLMAASLLVPAPSWAGLPYYNQHLGYTIWLPGGWLEADDAVLARFARLRNAVVPAQADQEVGYVLASSQASVWLLVSRLQGRVVSKDDIGNFNRFVVAGLLRSARTDGEASLRLRKANFSESRNMLRLELDGTDPSGRAVVSVVYIVYTTTGMLRFMGIAPSGDASGLRAVDDVVSTLYFDHGLRQD